MSIFLKGKNINNIKINLTSIGSTNPPILMVLLISLKKSAEKANSLILKSCGKKPKSTTAENNQKD